MTVQMQAEPPRVPSTKSCSNSDCSCHNPQSLESFSIRDRATGRRVSWCKTCVNIYTRSHYRKQNPDKFRKPKLGCGEISYASPEGEEPYAIIPLHGKYGTGKSVKVSLCDIERVKQFTWYGDPYGYAHAFVTVDAQKRKFKMLKMHRFILDVSDGVWVDHERDDRLDNRRSKIREATPAENNWNKKGKEGRQASAFKGVRPMHKSNKFSAFLNRTYLGSFDTEEEAARAYDACARFHYGEFARCNFEGTENRSAEEIRSSSDVKVASRKTSKYQGVSFAGYRKKWRAVLNINRDRLRLGQFETEIEAARVYDDARAKHGLPRVNFPEPCALIGRTFYGVKKAVT